MTTWFISDLHLHPRRSDLARAFYRFADKKIADSDTLYILGDFFDAWIGDDEDHPFYLAARDKLRSLGERDIDVYFMHGNRDFLIQSGFAKDAGVTLIDDPTSIEIAGKKVLLMHGDSLCTRDAQYMAFRNQVRSNTWQQTVLAIPLEQRRVMAAEMRKKSKSMNSNKAEDIMDVTPAEVDAVIRKFNVDILLHGHTHRPARHKLPDKKERIVLGDWDQQGWYVKADDFTIELESFDI